MVVVFLRAGYSAAAGVPLASQLFSVTPLVDKISRQQLVERVVSGWRDWHKRTGGQPEEYLAHLEKWGGKQWRDAQWYVGLVIALRMGKVELVGLRPTITRHNVDRTTRVDAHEDFWTGIFSVTDDVAVITTNYDILAERGLRHCPRPRVPRPGFHYGSGPEELVGGGYPSYAHIQKIKISGRVPLLKLHGSISWSLRNGKLLRYHDCRPAIRGDPAIVAPVVAKMLPPFLAGIWKSAMEILRQSDVWLVVGYSLPEYDRLVRDLFVQTWHDGVSLHLFNRNPTIAAKFNALLGNVSVHEHPGIPEGNAHVRSLIKALVSPAP